MKFNASDIVNVSDKFFSDKNKLNGFARLICYETNTYYHR